jgi:hypothetical protein
MMWVFRLVDHQGSIASPYVPHCVHSKSLTPILVEPTGLLTLKTPVLPDKSYYLIFLTFFVRGVNLESFVFGPAKENPEP